MFLITLLLAIFRNEHSHFFAPNHPQWLKKIVRSPSYKPIYSSGSVENFHLSSKNPQLEISKVLSTKTVKVCIYIYIYIHMLNACTARVRLSSLQKNVYVKVAYPFYPHRVGDPCGVQDGEQHQASLAVHVPRRSQWESMGNP